MAYQNIIQAIDRLSMFVNIKMQPMIQLFLKFLIENTLQYCFKIIDICHTKIPNAVA